MSASIIVTGTDTDVGKTVFCAGLTRLVQGAYWKPVQSGLAGETDSALVQRLAELPAERILPEAWRLRTPASPHLAAEIDGVAIDAARLTLPAAGRTLIVEGAGGLLVPLTRHMLLVDLFRRWGAPVVLCARTRLGTINHTLLSIEALRSRAIPLLGIAFIGDAHADNERIIGALGDVPVLGRLPYLDPLTPGTLAAAFAQAFAREQFLDPAATAATGATAAGAATGAAAAGAATGATAGAAGTGAP
ncbi:MAG TPA: dethiobiotin synthase [Steroidobacteraceae bacterium]|nr:dethiobiotin synthase [Steroidobacteraceae bacterium]